MNARPRRLALCALVTAALCAMAALVHAQGGTGISDELGEALDEERAFAEAQAGHHIKAREIAERVVREDPQSFIGHFVLGYVHHYGEANFARALFYTQRSYDLFRQQHGDTPVPPAPWRWHARILRELVWTHGDLEHYEQQLEYMEIYTEKYEPDFVAERAWPYMKLRRFDQAREAARLGQMTGDERQVELALNALCAIEFEAGDDEAAYDACREALDFGGASPATQSAVDFTNFAEAARSVFRLDEAERVDLLATEARLSWYGNPWLELAELYVRGGRYVEALNALKQVNAYRTRRPPHVRDADRNEARRALASFFLVIGRADDAVGVAQKALDAPDRRAHTSRDPAQDRAIAALLHRAALRLRAERAREAALGGSIVDGIAAGLQALADRWGGWLSGRVAAKNLADDDRLIGTFQIGTHRSAVMPPWLVLELADVLGAGVVEEAVRRARAEDDREGSDAYYDAFGAEAAMVGGDATRARELATRALVTLDPAEALLRARMHALVAEASRRLDDPRRATEAYGDAFQTDPGVFRRIGWTVPARFEASGGIAEDVASLVRGGPRFDDEGWGMVVQVRGDRAQITACLLDVGGNQLACSETRAEGDGEGEDELVARAARDFHGAAFAPRVDLSQTDANSLDGSNRVSRNPLETLVGPADDLDL